MATGNRRDVKLVVQTETPGAERLGGLAAQFRELAAAGGDAGPSFARLADELDAAAAATKRMRDAEAASRADATAARAALDQQRDALARLRAESTATSRATEEHQQQERGLKLAILDAQGALREKRAALAGASAETRAAVAAEKGLQEQARATAAAIRASSAEATTGTTAVTRAVQDLQGQLRTIQGLATAALGGSAVVALGRDIAQTADAYRMLGARVRIAVGDVDASKAALAGVFEVAQRTGVAVEEIGGLFTRLMQAGKELKLSQGDALRMAEAVAQATQLSGASAQEAASAVTQFAQAIGSGVLQGDELKSLFETSPRLVQALADGLGVATGKLKELGAAGSLTSAQVIAALQGQSAALQSEFDRLPLTLTRAMNNLGTAWTAYLGHVSEARGATSSIAGVIDGLSKNLDTVVSLLYSAGKAAVAFTAANLAKAWLESAAAIASTATATRTATAATVAATAATTADTAARVANTAATVAGAEAAAASAGRLGAILGGLKLFALVGVLTNLREIGTAIGEGVARWVGYGKAIDDAERSARAQADAARAQAQQIAAVAQAAQQAADKAAGLNDASRKIVAEFDGLVRKGESTAEALGKVGKALDLSNIAGIRDAGTALDVLGQRGTLAANQIREAMARALDGKDLAIFETNARAAFDGSQQGARRLAAAIDAITDEALRRAGTSVRELQSGFSAASSSAINDLDAVSQALDRVGAKGDATGRALSAAIGKALDASNTAPAVQAVMDRIDALGKSGRLTGDALAEAMEKARRRLDDLKAGVNSTDEAFRALGLRAPAELARVAAASREAWEKIKGDASVALADKQEAFKRYAETVRASADSERAALLRVQGEALGLSVTFDEAGRAIVRSLAEAGGAVDGLAGRMRGLADEADRAARSMSSVYDAETKARSDRITAGRGGAKYDAQGWALDASGQRATAGSYLPPPDDSGAWTWVPMLGDFTNYPFGGYWAKATPGTGGRMGSTQIYTGANGIGYGRGFNVGPGVAGSMVNWDNPMAPGRMAGLGASAPAAAAPDSSPTHRVEITLGGKKTTINTASPADQQALASLLAQLETAAGRGG